MLQALRNNLKGTVAIIVVGMLVIPFALFGVDALFVNSVRGDIAAEVNGESISNVELARAIEFQKQAIIAQSGIEPNSDIVSEENLRSPVLKRLTQRAALVQSAQSAGMGIDVDRLNKEISGQEQFYVDGRFNVQRYRQLLANYGYTPATYMTTLGQDLILNQQSKGFANTSFITEQELSGVIGLAQQKRTFFHITLPSKTIKDSITIDNESIQAYYDKNQLNYQVPDKVTVEYIELSIAGLASKRDVPEEEIKAQYEQELATFNSEPEYQIAHILIENASAPEQAEKVKAVEAGMAKGTDFSALVKQYSDDAGTRDNGGDLGTVLPGIYPESFEQAAFALEQGAVSQAVTTDAGVHFIKMLKKTIPQPPSYESQKPLITKRIKTAAAEEEYIVLAEQMDSLTFSSDNLTEAAESLGLSVQSTQAFSRNGGPGIAAESAVVKAAFSEEVLKEGHNSAVIELQNNRSIVLRLKELKPAHIQPLDQVKSRITETLLKEAVEKKLTETSNTLREQLQSGGDPKEVAEAAGYVYGFAENVQRSDVTQNREVVTKAFTLPKPEQDKTVYEGFSLTNGDYVLLGLQGVEYGKTADMTGQQVIGLTSRLRNQIGQYETLAYESFIEAQADIDIR